MPNSAISGMISKPSGTVLSRLIRRFASRTQRAAAFGLSRAMYSWMARRSCSAVSEKSTGSLFLANAQLLEDLLRRPGTSVQHVIDTLIQHACEVEQVDHPFVPLHIEQYGRGLAVLGDDDRPLLLPHFLQDRRRLSRQFLGGAKVFRQADRHGHVPRRL